MMGQKNRTYCMHRSQLFIRFQCYFFLFFCIHSVVSLFSESNFLSVPPSHKTLVFQRLFLSPNYYRWQVSAISGVYLAPEHTAPTSELPGSVSYVAMTGFCYKAGAVLCCTRTQADANEDCQQDGVLRCIVRLSLIASSIFQATSVADGFVPFVRPSVLRINRFVIRRILFLHGACASVATGCKRFFQIHSS